jgi:hypothetical protein
VRGREGSCDLVLQIQIPGIAIRYGIISSSKLEYIGLKIIAYVKNA